MEEQCSMPSMSSHSPVVTTWERGCLMVCLSFARFLTLQTPARKICRTIFIGLVVTDKWDGIHRNCSICLLSLCVSPSYNCSLAVSPDLDSLTKSMALFRLVFGYRQMWSCSLPSLYPPPCSLPVTLLVCWPLSLSLSSSQWPRKGGQEDVEVFLLVWSWMTNVGLFAWRASAPETGSPLLETAFVHHS